MPNHVTKIIIKQSIPLGKTERKDQIVIFSAHVATVCSIILFVSIHVIFSLLYESLLCTWKSFTHFLYLSIFICLFCLLESTHDFTVDHTCGNTKDNVRLTFDWSSSDVTTGMSYSCISTSSTYKNDEKLFLFK
jgi:hypothetical protein